MIFEANHGLHFVGRIVELELAHHEFEAEILEAEVLNL